MDRLQRRVDRAPGLPYAPQGGFSQFEKLGTEKLPVTSINFDYIPGSLESPRSLWVELASYPPSTLNVGTPVRVHTGPTSSDARFHLLLFEIDDIIGNKVVLLPYKRQQQARPWLPTFHSPAIAPGAQEALSQAVGSQGAGPGDGLWGYDFRNLAVSPAMYSSQSYGYGHPTAYLEFTPLMYTDRASQLQAVRMKEGWYADYPIVPGWKSADMSQMNQYSS